MSKAANNQDTLFAMRAYLELALAPFAPTDVEESEAHADALAEVARTERRLEEARNHCCHGSTFTSEIHDAVGALHRVTTRAAAQGLGDVSAAREAHLKAWETVVGKVEAIAAEESSLRAIQALRAEVLTLRSIAEAAHRVAMPTIAPGPPSLVRIAKDAGDAFRNLVDVVRLSGFEPKVPR